jgi:hypothetical protein
MVLRWVAKIMKREKQKTYNSKTARERGVLRWVLIGGSWWPALRQPKREMGLQAGTPLTKKINEVSALMGGGHSGLGGRSSVDRKGKAVWWGRRKR